MASKNSSLYIASAFYSVNPDLRNIQVPQNSPSAPAPIDLNAVIELLQKSPEFVQMLATLLPTQKAC